MFKTEFAGPIHRMRDIPSGPDMPELKPAEKDMIMHVALPILGGHILMGTDALESMGQTLFWGAYFGTFVDKFGVQWMINCMEAAA